MRSHPALHEAGVFLPVSLLAFTMAFLNLAVNASREDVERFAELKWMAG